MKDSPVSAGESFCSHHSITIAYYRLIAIIHKYKANYYKLYVDNAQICDNIGVHGGVASRPSAHRARNPSWADGQQKPHTITFLTHHNGHLPLRRIFSHCGMEKKSEVKKQ